MYMSVIAIPGDMPERRERRWEGAGAEGRIYLADALGVFLAEDCEDTRSMMGISARV